ncbi:DUF1064 domain-containing protein [Luteimonas sp. TWI662]|uniref:DUF1064 domain-containing protein n=1 Tax=Luteimonas sp. TWI662 TaxID=3136789 RepID=UPI003207A657
MSKAPRSLRYSSTATMPAGMRALHDRQHGYRPAVPAAATREPRNKYGAVPTVVDGIRFDSKREATYYQRLKLRVQSGEVIYFLRQTPVHLPGGTKLVVDFVEFLADGRVRYVDVKGRETPVFRLKRREVEHHYPIRIELE